MRVYMCVHITGTAARSFEWTAVPMQNIGKEVTDPFLKTHHGTMHVLHTQKCDMFSDAWIPIRNCTPVHLLKSSIFCLRVGSVRNYALVPYLLICEPTLTEGNLHFREISFFVCF